MSASECLNCCAPVNLTGKFADLEVPNPKAARTGTRAVNYVPVAVALNYIYKVSGKRIALKSDDKAAGHLGLCQPCWEIVSNLYLLHKELTALTRVNSLVNKTFQVLDSAIRDRDTKPNDSVSKLTPAPTATVTPVSASEARPPQQRNSEINNDLNDVDDVDRSFTPETHPASAIRRRLGTPDQSLPVKRNRVQAPIRDPLDTTPIVNIKGSLLNRMNMPKSQPQQRVFLKLTPLSSLLPVFAKPSPEKTPQKLGFSSISDKTDKGELGPSAPTSASELLKLQRGLRLRKPISDSSIILRQFQSTKSPVLNIRSRSRTENPDDTGSISIPVASVNRRKQQIAARVHEVRGKEALKFKVGTFKDLNFEYLLFAPKKDESKVLPPARALEDPASLTTPGCFCPECGKTFASSSYLDLHIQILHVSPLKPRKRLTCTEPECTYSTHTNKSLKGHTAAIHRNSTIKFECSRCSQAFRLAPELREHQGFCCDPTERPHICLNCGRRFKLKHHLEYHYSETHKMGKKKRPELWFIQDFLSAHRRHWVGGQEKENHQRNSARIKLKIEQVVTDLPL